jgi:hypothetical protein
MMSGRQANNVDSILCARRYDEWTPVTEFREWKDSVTNTASAGATASRRADATAGGCSRHGSPGCILITTARTAIRNAGTSELASRARLIL